MNIKKKSWIRQLFCNHDYGEYIEESIFQCISIVVFFCNECVLREITQFKERVRWEFCPACGHVNTGYSTTLD